MLVVDDHATNRRALCGQLRLWGFEASDAGSGAQALAMLGQSSFDLAILDYHMPEMDGMELARRIRAGTRSASLPMVLLSSSLVLARDDPEGFFAARLLKPARQSSLFDAIAVALGSGAPRRSADAADGGRASASGLRVLVADDNDVNRNIARLVVRRFGAEADEVANGREAVDAVARSAGGRGAYDLVLMDVQMPVMDGLEATRAIRGLALERPSHAWPRIVAMTANAMQEDRATCLAAGMDDYLTKPLDFEEVGRVLRSVAKVGSHANAPDAAPPAANGFMDWSRLGELAEYDTPGRTVVRGAVASLVEQAPACLEEIRRSIEGRDAAHLRAAAHRLKGAASNLGAVALAGCASRIETAAKSGELDAVEPLVGDLVVTLEASLRELRSYVDEPAKQETA